MRIKIKHFLFKEAVLPLAFIMLGLLFVHIANAQPEGVDKNTLSNNSIERLFKDASEDYRRGNWVSASRKYNLIYKTGLENHILFYNMGNCYYRMSQPGAAILYWEKGLKLEPSDRQLRQNLEFASQRIVDRFTEPERQFLSALLSGFASLFTAGGWAVAAIIFIWISSAFVLVLQLSRISLLKRVSLYLIALFIFMAVVSGMVSIAKHHDLKNERYGILLAKKINIRSGPGERNPILFIMHEGVKVKVEGLQDDWTRISVPNGNNGWVRNSTLGII